MNGDERGWLRKQFEPEVVRRRTHRTAIVACAIFAFLVAVALFRPGSYSVGPVVIGLSSPGNPLLELGAAILVTVASARRSPQLLNEVSRAAVLTWSGWTTGGRIFALALALKIGMTIVGLGRITDERVSLRRQVRMPFEKTLESVFVRGDRYTRFAVFFERARRQLPADARVVYVGHAECQILAYVVYPRPVFMHPNDRYAAWIEHQTRDYGHLPDDELFRKSYPPPGTTPSFETFVNDHRITHEVKFVESNLARCRIEAIP